MSANDTSKIWQTVVSVLASIVMAFLLWDRGDMREQILENKAELVQAKVDLAVVKEKLVSIDRRTEEILREIRDTKRTSRGN